MRRGDDDIFGFEMRPKARNGVTKRDEVAASASGKNLKWNVLRALHVYPVHSPATSPDKIIIEPSVRGGV